MTIQKQFDLNGALLGIKIFQIVFKKQVEHGVFRIFESSRPGESHPQALTEPYVRLSSHTALHVPHKLPSLHKLLVPPITG